MREFWNGVKELFYWDHSEPETIPLGVLLIIVIVSLGLLLKYGTTIVYRIWD